MTTERIIEFLKVGELTNFPFGTHREIITDQLGDSPGWTVAISRKDKRPAIMKYDQTEFYFNAEAKQKLRGVQVTYSQPADKKGFDMDYDDLRQSLTYQQTIDFLIRNNISFEEELSEYDKNDKIIKTSGQIIFYFTDNERLQKFGRFLKHE